MKLDVSRPGYVVVFSLVFSGVFTAIVMVLQVAAEGRIKRNEVLRDQRALVKVFDLAPNAEVLTEAKVDDLVRRRVDSTMQVTDAATGMTFTVYHAYEGEKGASALKAIAFPISGTGFWARIDGLLALAPDRSKVLRAVFTQQSETPGLGGRIQEEAFQRDQFAGLNAMPPPEGKPWIYVVSAKPANQADPAYGRSIEAITGATQTSRAVGRFLNVELPAFRRAMDSAEKAGGKQASHD